MMVFILHSTENRKEKRSEKCIFLKCGRVYIRSQCAQNIKKPFADENLEIFLAKKIVSKNTCHSFENLHVV